MRVPIGEHEEKCPPMQPLHFPQKKITHPTRHNIPRRVIEAREEREGIEKENQAEAEASDNEEEEVERGPLQAQIDLVAKQMSGMASSVYEEFVDY